MPELRPYQIDNRERLRAAYRAKHRAVLYQLATGGGKTIVFGDAISRAVARGHRVLVLTHLRELIQQASRKLDDAGVKHGIICAGLDRDHDASVLVASVQTVGRRLERLQALGLLSFRLIVIDEAHHCRARTYERIFEALPDAWILGVTATPARLDGKGLGEPVGPFTCLVCGPTTHELIELKWLSPVRCFAPGDIDLRGIHIAHGDYDIHEAEQAVNRRVITGNAIEHYRKHLDGKPAIVFCTTIAHSMAVAEQFCEAGYRAAHVDGDTGKADRERLIYGLETGEVQVLCNCALISEGVDVPKVSGIIMLRPTASLVLHRQQIGRGMRPADGKDALIVLDHVGNIGRHGIPEMEPQWKLTGIDKKKGDGTAPTWTCRNPECGCINPIHRETCAACGAPRPRRPREAIEHVDGELTEFTLEMALAGRRLSDRDAARLSIGDLVSFAEARRLSGGWVYHRALDRARAQKAAGDEAAALATLRDFAAYRGYRRGWERHEIHRL